MKHYFGAANFLLCSIILLSCNDDPLTLDDVSENVEPEIAPFIETFLSEARLRGETFELQGFEATFSSDDIDMNEDICGKASSFSEKRDYFTIRKSDQCWIDQPEATREALVFHELGHAFLDRPHRDDRFENGLVKSIMETGMLKPYNQFTPLLRAYLFDEMFDEATPLPAWAFDKTEEVIIDINGDLEQSDAGWEFVSSKNIFRRSAITGIRTSEAAASGSFSLKLQSTEEFSETLFWIFKTGELNNVPETADLIVSVRLRMQGVKGGGVILAGGFTKDNEVLTFTSTETTGALTGTSVFQTQQFTIPYYPNTPAVVSIVLAFLSNTTGLVFFDDISLKAVYNPAFGPV